MNLSKYIQLSAALLLVTATSSASAAHVQCNTHDDIGIGACPRNNQMSYVCEDGQNMCCTWTNLPIVRNQRMQRRVDDMTSEIDLPKFGNCQRYTYTGKHSTKYGNKKQYQYDTLTGTSWVATEIKYPHGRMRRVLDLPKINGYEPSLSFNEDGTYTANGGCIERSGKVEMSTSEFDLNEISAVMTCDDIRVDNQERAFEKAVLNQDNLQYSIDQQVLTLYDEEGEMVASFVPLDKKSKKKKGGHLRVVQA